MSDVLIALFWALGLIAAGGVAVWIVRPLLIPGGRAASRAAHEISALKAQLEEVARERSRGGLSEIDADAAERELGRRLIRAADELGETEEAAPAPKTLSRRVGVGGAVLAVLGAALAYFAALGAPTLLDRPLATRDFAAERAALRMPQSDLETLFAGAAAPGAGAADPSAAETTPAPQPPAGGPLRTPEGGPSDDAAEAASPERVEELLAQARARLEARPDDAQSRVGLGEALLRLGRPAEAWPFFAEAIEILGAEAPPWLHSRQGQAMALATGGVLSREAVEAFARAPSEPQSRYFLGLAAAQSGAPREALNIWAGLYVAAPNAPFAPNLLADVRRIAGELRLDPDRVVATLRARAGAEANGEGGPSAADIEAASELSAEERREMIEGMVAGLAERLEDDPRDVEGWARLMRSYVTLGREDDAAAAYARAQDALASDAAALAFLRQTALVIGIAE